MHIDAWGDGKTISTSSCFNFVLIQLALMEGYSTMAGSMPDKVGKNQAHFTTHPSPILWISLYSHPVHDSDQALKQQMITNSEETKECQLA